MARRRWWRWCGRNWGEGGGAAPGPRGGGMTFPSDPPFLFASLGRCLDFAILIEIKTCKSIVLYWEAGICMSPIKNIEKFLVR